MRKLLTVALVAGTALVACDRLPQQPADTQEMEVRASQGAEKGGMQVEHAWGNDHLWRFLIPKTVDARLINSEGVMAFGHPSNEASLTPYYQIGPAAGDDGPQHYHPDHGHAHDHVIHIPRANKGSFTANCNLRGVFTLEDGEELDGVATSGPSFDLPKVGTVHQVHAADIDGDGDLEDLTSVEKVKKAADLEPVIILKSSVVFTCPVKDIEG